MKTGDKIALLREDAGLTQEDLAKKIGISRASLSHYEKNRRSPDYDTLVKIANFFVVSTDYLLSNTEKEAIDHEYLNIIHRWKKEGRTAKEIEEDDRLMKEFKKRIKKHLSQ